MTDILLHTCCGPCASAVVPAVRERGLEPLAWFGNPNIQPAAELARRTAAVRTLAEAAGLELVVAPGPRHPAAWRRWAAGLAAAAPGERCAACLALRLDAAAAAAAVAGLSTFSTTLGVSPYQRHDLIRAGGAAAAEAHDVEFVYFDLRDRFAQTYARARALGLYRQPYCGCAASKWEAWHERRARRPGAAKHASGGGPT
jgi:predicted adenine nucleotide alpha hydrolase (AANH) superfamily ATPase